MLIAQHIEDSPNDESLRALCEQHANQGVYFMLNLSSCPEEQGSIWDISLGFVPICLDSSDRLLKLEGSSSSLLRDELRKLQWNPPLHDSSELDRRDGGTVLSSPRGQRR